MLPRKQESRLPPQEKPASVIQLEDGRCKKWLCLAAASCGWVLVACPGAQVRGTPGPEECPPGAVETMEQELRIDFDETSIARFLADGGGDSVTVSEGSGAVELIMPMGALRVGTVLTGDFILGENRLYGRFRQAQTPDGTVYPVCIQLVHAGQGFPIEAKSGPDAARVFYKAEVRARHEFK
jgi:eukaryotic-like serine/threonine-protein kinase